MAKCSKCGRKGLFLKLNESKFCGNCAAELAHEEKMQQLNTEIKSLISRRDKARISCTESEYQLVAINSDIAKAQKKAAALKAMAKSIKAALDEIRFADCVYGAKGTANLDAIRNMDLDDLLPEPDLNCLTAKDLAAKYRNVRKQIVEVCKSYEERYTTKTIAALYKLMVLALESEFENILYKLQFGKLETGIAAVKELTAKYYAIAIDGNQNIAPSLHRFIVQIETLYIDAVNIEYEYYVQRERAKEEQRAIREQMRQEAEERKRLEQERKKVEAEESKYNQEIERIQSQMRTAHAAEIGALMKRLEEMRTMVGKVQERKAEIVNLQNGKAGTVYIISNIGSFGENVYKIGMTRRIDPQDRVNELGDASVPFPFDVHSFIFSEDAVALETALHHQLNNRRVNKVNLRKEFFHVTIDELQQMVEKIDPTAPFKVTALAEQYRQSLSIDDVPENIPVSVEEE